MRSIGLIVVHCSDTPEHMDIGAAEIRGWHVRDNGWSDIGYHFVIRRDGRVETGRPVGRIGAHVRGHNRTSIGLCLVGRDSFSDEQWRALAALVTRLGGQYRDATVVGHRDLDAGKTCPNFDVMSWWAAAEAGAASGEAAACGRC